MRGADIALNPYANIDVVDVSYFTGTDTGIEDPIFDYISILVHEFGHAAGIRHHPSAIENEDRMHPKLHYYNDGRHLSFLDEYAIEQLYWTHSVGQNSHIPCEDFDTSPYGKCSTGSTIFSLGSLFNFVEGNGNLPTNFCNNFGLGMLVNSIPNNLSYIPCVSTPIKLSPDQTYACGWNHGYWHLYGTNSDNFSEEELKNKGWTKGECIERKIGSIFTDKKWKCSYVTFFVSLEEIDDQGLYLNNIGITSYDRQVFKLYTGDFNDYGVLEPLFLDHDVLHDINNTFSLEPGKYYRVGLLHSGTSDYRDFRYYEEYSMILNNLNHDVIAGSLYLVDANVTQNIDVTTRLSIDILPESTIDGGTYHLDPFLNCVSGSNNHRISNSFNQASENIIIETKDDAFLYEYDSLISVSQNKVNIYPNPVKNILNISFPEDDLFTVKIINIYGQVIMSEIYKTNNITVKTNKYSSGVYLLNIYQEDNLIYSKKIIINH